MIECRDCGMAFELDDAGRCGTRIVCPFCATPVTDSDLEMSLNFDEVSNRGTGGINRFE